MSVVKIARHADIKHEYVDGFSSQPVLVGAYDQARFEKCSLLPGHSVKPKTFSMTQNNQLFIFTTGKGFITTPRKAWNITEVGVFIPEFDREEFEITASMDRKEPLEFLHIITELNDYDNTCLREARITLPRWRGLSEGWTYYEDFKDEDKVTSLMLIEHRNLGRLSMGAVLGKGPDTIGTHVHNELQQWYFPLPGSSFTYTADGESIHLQGGDLSFTPSGFNHGSSADEGEILDYIWFELCTDGYPGEIK
ncbi:MAG: cupin domain-containing protein [Anaerovorax sp.]|nr:cupin domain-containing protein [Anaerovorax sp.]